MHPNKSLSLHLNPYCSLAKRDRSQEMFEMLEFDGFAKSRHSGENRSPETLQLIEKTGFRLSPE
jgi:hypothetical protein